ncbi:hypothetical protein L0156_14955 [bacterium]|nr:hypothetical protein [bacterium]
MTSVHPAGYQSSNIRGLYGRYGVGWAVDFAGNMHAAFWDVVTNAFTEAHPPGVYTSGINGTHRNLGAGAYQATPQDDWHAMMWDLTNSNNNIDLHNLLPVGLYSNSATFGIWRNTATGSVYIGGYATSVSDGQWYAMVWYIP